MKKLTLVPLIIIFALGCIFTGCGEPEAETTAKTSATTAATTEPTTAATTEPTTAATTEPTTAATTEPTTGGPQTGGVLRIILIEGPTTPFGMPEHMAGMSPGIFGAPMTDLLLKSDRSGKVLPCLATDWEWSNNYTTLTLTLRQGVRFHDGTPFNAEAVKWNFDRHMAAGTVGTENIESYEVVDDYTFRINIKQYQSIWIEKISAPGYTLGMITSPTAVEEYGVEYVDWHPVGTGPFKFKEYERDNYLEMERNDDYWGSPQPYLDGIKISFIADPMTATMSFEAGEGDVYYAIMHGHEIARDLVSQGYKADSAPSLMYVLIPSSGNPDSPLAKLKVREAIDYAIDKEKIAETLFFGAAKARIQMVETTQTSEPADVEGRKYDPDRARELLEEAGYPDGFPLTMYCGVHFMGDDKVMVQSYLNAVGITTEIDQVTPGKWIDMETNGWEDGLLVSVQGGHLGIFLDRFWWKPDEPNWERGLYYNAVHRPDELQALIEAYLVAPPDSEQQSSLAKEIGQFMYDECIAIPLYETLDFYALHDNVMDTKWGDPLYPTPWSFTDVWLSSE